MKSFPGPVPAVHFSRSLKCFLLALLIAAKGSAQTEKLIQIKALEKEMITAYQNSDFEKIFRTGDSMLVLAPGNKRVLGSCFDIAWNKLKDTARALHYLQKAVEQHPYDEYFLTNYGWLLLLNRQFTKAVIVCTNAYQANRSTVSSIINYGHSLYLMGLTKDAAALYEEAIALTTSLDSYLQMQDADYVFLHSLFPSAGFDSVRIAEREKMNAALVQYAKANKLYNEFEQKNVKGQTTIKEIIPLLNAGLEEEKNQTPFRAKRISKYLTTLGNTIYNTGELKTAIKKYEEAISYNFFLKDYTELGKIYFNMGVIYKTIRNLDSAFYYFDGSAYYYSRAGNLLEEAGAYDAMANVLTINGETERALPIVRDKVIPAMEKYNAYEEIIDPYLFLSNYYQDKGEADSANYFL